MKSCLSAQYISSRSIIPCTTDSFGNGKQDCQSVDRRRVTQSTNRMIQFEIKNPGFLTLCLGLRVPLTKTLASSDIHLHSMPRGFREHSLSQPPDSMLATICAFTSKIVQTIVRARSTKLQHLSLSTLADLNDFWRHGLPIHVDIFNGTSRQLLERWTLSFEAR